MRYIESNNTATSPVIGTILLVAVTVVLVAIITAVLMGVMKNPNEKEVGLIMQPYWYKGEVKSFGNYPVYQGVLVVVHGGTDADSLTSLTVRVIGSDGTVYLHERSGVDFADFRNKNNLLALPEYSHVIGVPLFYAVVYNTDQTKYPPWPSQKVATVETARVIVTGTFTDNTSQVLANGRLSWPKDGRGDGGQIAGGETDGIFGDGRWSPWDYDGGKYENLLNSSQMNHRFSPTPILKSGV